MNRKGKGLQQKESGRDGRLGWDSGKGSDWEHAGLIGARLNRVGKVS